MAARRPNETSPLLQGSANGRGPTAPPGTTPAPAARDSRSLSQLHRSRYALIPLLLVAILSILWIFSFSEDPNSHAYHVKHLRAPLVNSSAFSDAELLTLAPPFAVAGHPIAPRMLNRSAFAGRAIPTNQFWSNLLIGDDHGLNIGAGPVTLSPYTVRCLPKRVDVSYGDTRRVVTSGNITEYFNVDAAFTAYARKTPPGSALLGDGNATHRELVAFDELSATVQYRFDNASVSAASAPTQWMNALLVRGSPYVTVEYQQLQPVLEFNATVYAINNVPVQELAEPVPSAARQQWRARRFEIDLGVYGATQGAVVRQKWVLYFASERTLQLQLANEKDYRAYNLRGELTTPTNVRLVDADAYTGAARLAVVPVVDRDGALATLDKHAGVYPTAGHVETCVEEENKTAFATFRWSAKTLAGHDVAPNASSSSLLQLAHAHHVASFSKTRQMDPTFRVLELGFGHRTVKSFMTPVVGNAWVLEEPLADVGFYGPTSELEAVRAAPKIAGAILTALRNDSTFAPEAQDPYYFGKEIARQARLVLIADALDADTTTRDKLLDNLEDWVGPWLVGSNGDQFVYDQDWGGLCSVNGLRGVFWMTDFGNGWYNDHHFHYGYILYALAVVAQFRPAFAATHKAAILAIARDIANADATDPYFPVARHFSWFDGHSFASGVYLLDGGKSQESVSEAINAYYGVYLLGRALAIPQVEHTGRVLMALESRAAQTYWQMPSTSTIYEPLYAQNRMTGQIASTKVSYTTWFGPEIEHMHLINIMPFTPVTATFVSAAYVQEEFPVLDKEAFQRREDPIDDRWKGYAYLDLAIIDPKRAWELVQQLDFFDDGSSRANSLFWIATRPNATQALLVR